MVIGSFQLGRLDQQHAVARYCVLVPQCVPTCSRGCVNGAAELRVRVHVLSGSKHGEWTAIKKEPCQGYGVIVSGGQNPRCLPCLPALVPLHCQAGPLGCSSGASWALHLFSLIPGNEFGSSKPHERPGVLGRKPGQRRVCRAQGSRVLYA